MKFSSFLSNGFCRYGLDKARYNLILPRIFTDSGKMNKRLSYIGLAFLTVLFFVSLGLTELSAFKFVYLGMACAYLVFSLLFTFVKFKGGWNIFFSYVLVTSFYCFGFLLASQYPDKKSTIIQMMFTIMPAFVLDRPYRAISYIAVVAASFIVFLNLHQDQSIRFPEGFNCICLSVVGMLAHFIVGKLRCDSYLAIEERSLTISELEKAEEGMRAASEVDALTGLKNRRVLFEEIARMNDGRSPAPKAVFMIDIDRFKSINDTYGHGVGDRYLMAAGAFLKSIEEEEKASCYRYGGDEFTILVHEGDEESIKALLLSLHEQAGSIKVDGGSIPVSISIGCVMLIDRPSHDYEHEINEADMALYKAKESGRDRTVII